ncbi:BREX-1 system adenine-specific DNA-methyltransferase PglX [Klebsiella pneumoniae]|nr:BREX-1 system adenine-specific DNA-methyltransferase PglX [Klebsiella pneumoniae]MEB2987622.1 BREX-1 system adenine-specific DNA-methyltransferase PglX [Klebsiella pneumoniae]
MRKNILNKFTIEAMVHMGNGVMKIAFGTNATIFRTLSSKNLKGKFYHISQDDISPNGTPFSFPSKKNRKSTMSSKEFHSIPGKQILYWITPSLAEMFNSGLNFGNMSTAKKGVTTGNNDKYLRLWHEVSIDKTSMFCKENSATWYPVTKGGKYRKWYGNKDYLINWKNNGFEIKNSPGFELRNESFFFQEGLTWGDVSSGDFSMRYHDEKGLFEGRGPMAFADEYEYILGFMNSNIAKAFLKLFCPTLTYNVGDVVKVPLSHIPSHIKEKIIINTKRIIELTKDDYNSYETSWKFKKSHLISGKSIRENTSLSIQKYMAITNSVLDREESNNSLFITAWGLSSEITHKVDYKNISLNCNDHYLYGYESFAKRNSDIISNFLSYTIGCQMGRYSLDREGLVYAHEGNKGFADLVAEGAYKTFPADSDGILPLMDDEWFEDDVTSRVKEFVRTVWGEEHLQENLEFIAESLCLYAIKPKKGESALETIRRYLSTQFWKDHLKMYKKRPIYWLFSSGKEKAFECLVYLHRYNDATLSRMRTEYVVPLLARYQANIDRLNDQLDEASGGEATRLKRERDSLIKKFSELRSYDDRLRHYADMRISIDLDDGVKVNYGKFGDLLADVKAITGNAPEVI